MFAEFFQDPVPDMQTAIARVRRGAAFLERVYGADWHTKLCRHARNSGHPFPCVSGQILKSGHWRLIFTSLTAATSYGLSCGLWDFLFYLQPPWVSRSYDRLAEAWKLVLQEIRASDADCSAKTVRHQAQRKRFRDSDSNSWSCVI
jgi:hypothetical protein